MNYGLQRREQWALWGVATMILLGFVVQTWRNTSKDDALFLNADSDGEWVKIGEFDAGAKPLGISQGLSSSMLSTTTASKAASTAAGIDLNTATQDALERIPGIGPAKAQAILLTRERLGGFTSLEQIMETPGIGEKTFEKILPYIKLSSIKTTPSLAPKQQEASTNEFPNQNKTTPISKNTQLNINTASEQDLTMAINGIGPVLAQRIIKEREKQGGQFTHIEQLRNISGIGDKRYQQIISQITLE